MATPIRPPRGMLTVEEILEDLGGPEGPLSRRTWQEWRIKGTGPKLTSVAVFTPDTAITANTDVLFFSIYEQKRSTVPLTSPELIACANRSFDIDCRFVEIPPPVGTVAKVESKSAMSESHFRSVI